MIKPIMAIQCSICIKLSIEYEIFVFIWICITNQSICSDPQTIDARIGPLATSILAAYCSEIMGRVKAVGRIRRERECVF